MMRPIVLTGLVCSAVLTAGAASAQSSCSRDALQSAADSYLAAQSVGDAGQMSLASDVDYREQFAPADIDTGVLTQPLDIVFSRSFLDTLACQAFVEIVVTDPANPYVMGVTLDVAGGRIDAIDALVTDADDWLFDAQGFHDAVKDEDWGEVPADRRDTRETLIAAATAYYDRFADPEIVVPFGDECYRVEGGIRTNGSPDAPANSCALGMPAEPGQLELVDRRFLTDPAIGAVVGFSFFGAVDGEPDIHLFRVNDERIRYVHAMTACSDNGCDFGTGNVLGGGAP